VTASVEPRAPASTADARSAPRPDGGSRPAIARAARLAAAALLAGLPAVAALAYVLRFTVDVPYYDEWRFVPLVESWQAGTLRWADVFAQHDGHRIPVARIAVLASVHLTGWDVRAEVWAGFAFLAATALLLLRLHWRASGPATSPARRAFGALPLLLVVFSLRQWENLLGPWAVVLFGVGFFAVVAFVLVEREPRPQLAAAACAAALASLTFTNGLLVWPVVAVQLALRSWRRGAGPAAARDAAPWLLGWLAIAAAFCALYFAGFDRAPVQGAGEPWHVAQRFLAAVGASLSVDPGVITGGFAPPLFRRWGLAVPLVTGALVVALAVAALAAALRRRELPAAERVAVALALFGLGSAAMLAVGRANLSVTQALSSRYATPVVLSLAALLLLQARVAGPEGWARRARAALVLAIVVSNVVALGLEWRYGRGRRRFLRDWAEAVRSYRTATDAQLANPHFSPEQIRAWSAALERRQLSVFRARAGGSR
jgi:hypothetical protein